MSGIIGLSYKVDEGEQKSDEFIHDLFWEVFFLQHLKKGYGGLATLSSDKNELIKLRTHRGPFREGFEKDLIGFIPPLGIGCTTSQTREPYLVEKSAFPKFVIGFSGNIINRQEIIAELIQQGDNFERTDDVVVTSHLITLAGYKKSKSLDDNFLHALKFMTNKIQGSYTLVILTPQKVYAVRSLDGHKQMVIGRKENAVLVASELPHFDNQSFILEREVAAGELISLNNGEYKTVGFIKADTTFSQPCIFDSVYSGNPPSIIFGITNVEFRQRLGAPLARKDIAKSFIPDVIIPVPDSGRFHALGYYLECVRQFLAGNINKLPVYLELLIKYFSAGRSFTPDEKEERDIEGEKKIIPAVEIDVDLRSERAKLILVIVDDSLVRGTQTRSKLVPKINALGFKENHLRFGYAKIMSPCLYGKSTKKYTELAAVDSGTGEIRSEEEIAKMLGVASCGFNNPEDLAEAAGCSLDQFCYDCAK